MSGPRPRDVGLLEPMMRWPDWVFTHDQLLSAMCSETADEGAPEHVVVQVCRLRGQLGAARALLDTVRGAGCWIP